LIAPLKDHQVLSSIPPLDRQTSIQVADEGAAWEASVEVPEIPAEAAGRRGDRLQGCFG